jgi:hypothetical protein
MTSSTIDATMDMTVKLGITLPKSIMLKIDQKRAIFLGADIFGERLKDILVVMAVKS